MNKALPRWSSRTSQEEDEDEELLPDAGAPPVLPPTRPPQAGDDGATPRAGGAADPGTPVRSPGRGPSSESSGSVNADVIKVRLNRLFDPRVELLATYKERTLRLADTLEAFGEGVNPYEIKIIFAKAEILDELA